MFKKEPTLEGTIKYFINNVNWTNKIGKGIGFLNSLDIPYEIVNKRRQIEEFTYLPLFQMKEDDYHLSKGGDRDDINEKKKYDFIGGEERKKAFRTAAENGALLKAITEYKGVAKGGQVARNINDLLKVGFKVRCLDYPLYGALNCIDKEKSICVWNSFLLDQNYKRVDGFPQDPSKMRYEGMILDGKTPEHTPFIKRFEKIFTDMWDKAVPAQKVLDDLEEKRNNYRNFKPKDNAISELYRME